MTRDDVGYSNSPQEYHGDDGCQSVCGHGFRCEETELHTGNHVRGACGWDDNGNQWTRNEGE